MFCWVGSWGLGGREGRDPPAPAADPGGSASRRRPESQRRHSGTRASLFSSICLSRVGHTDEGHLLPPSAESNVSLVHTPHPDTPGLATYLGTPWSRERTHETNHRRPEAQETRGPHPHLATAGWGRRSPAVSSSVPSRPSGPTVYLAQLPHQSLWSPL